MEQEVLRQLQPDQQLQQHRQPEPDYRQLPGVHPLPQDPSQRADEGHPSAGLRAVQHHHERARLPGLCRHQGKHQGNLTILTVSIFFVHDFIAFLYILTLFKSPAFEICQRHD